MNMVLEGNAVRQAPARRLTNYNMVQIEMPTTDTEKVGKAIPLHKAVTLVPACTPDFRCANIRASMERGLPEIAFADFHSRLAVIVGFGPSLHDTWHEIPETKEPHDVFTVSGAHSFLVERGVRVYGHSECDPRDHKYRLLTVTDPQTRFFIASRCHPSMFDHLLARGHDVRIVHTGRGEAEAKQVREINPRATIVQPASMVGLQTAMVAFWLGYRRFRFYGLDCSFRDPKGGQHAGEHPHRDPTVLEVEIAGRKFFTTYSMICSFSDFFNIAIQHPMGTFDLRGDGMLQWGEKVSRGAT